MAPKAVAPKPAVLASKGHSSSSTSSRQQAAARPQGRKDDGEEPENPISPIVRRPSNGKIVSTGLNLNQYDTRHNQAATKIGRVCRGGRARKQTANRYHVERRSAEEALHPAAYGLGQYAEMNLTLPEISDELRYHIRDQTVKQVLQQLGATARDWMGFEDTAFERLTDLTNGGRTGPEALPPGARAQLKASRLFLDDDPPPPPPSPGSGRPPGAGEEPGDDNHTGDQQGSDAASPGSAERSGSKYLLGKYDVCAVPARADYDWAFQEIPPIETVAASASQTPASPPTATAPPPGQRIKSPPANSSNAPRVIPTASTPAGPADHVAVTVETQPDCDGPAGFVGWFWVCHAGAPNIGESAQAEDFLAYSTEESEAMPQSPLAEGEEGSCFQQLQCCWKDRPGRSIPRRLNEDLYVKDMRHLWYNTILAMGRLGVEDAVLFPFGMGAFLRHLGKNDDRYLDDAFMRQLRLRVAEQVMAAIASAYGDRWRQPSPPPGQQDGRVGGSDCAASSPPSAPPTATQTARGGGARASQPSKKENAAGARTSSGRGGRGYASTGTKAAGASTAAAAPLHPLPARLHLCLMCSNAESTENHNVFVEAAGVKAKECPELVVLLRLYRNVDVLQLAHNLSIAQTLKVGVLNGANRKLLGNHWFQSGARFAIDENLHRRSASLARAALLLNMGTEPVVRLPTELPRNLRWLGGQTVKLSDPSPSPVAGQDTAVERPPGPGGGGGGGGPFGCCRRRPSTKAAAEVHGAPGAVKDGAKEDVGSKGQAGAGAGR